MGRPPAPGPLSAPSKALRMVLGLAAIIWAGILLGQLQVHQPWHLGVFEQFLSLSRFGPFHASWFFSQVWSYLKNFILFLGFLAAAFGLGSVCLARFFPAPRPRLETLIFSLALGLAGLALLIFLLGILHGLHAGLFIPLFSLLAAFGLVRAWQLRRELAPRAGWWWGVKPALTDRVLGSVLLSVIAGEVLMAGLPEMFFDALVYHLGVPAQWLQQGAIVPLPSVFFSNLPMGVEMLYTGALLLSNEVLCRFLHVGLGALAVLTAFALGRRWFGRRAGFWAAGILGTIPLWILNASVSGVDVGSVFFAGAALLALLNAACAEKVPPRGFWLAGLLMGSAWACKYNTAFLLVPAAVFCLMAYYLRHWDMKKMAWAGVQLGMGAFLIFSPWLIKNTVFTGNPVYPFFYRQIPSRFVEPAKMQQQMDGFKEFGHRTPLQILRLPWDLTFFYPTSNSFMGAVFLFLLPGLLWLGLRAKRAPPVEQVLLATAAATAVIWVTQTQIARYLLPGFLVLAVWSGALLTTWENWSSWLGKAARWSVLLLLGYSLVNAAVMALVNWDPLGITLGRQDRENYLDTHLMTNYLPMARTINALPGKVKVFVLGETRAYYLKQPATTVTVYDANPLLQWLEAGPTAEAVWRRLRAEGYTHVFVHEQEAARTRGYEPYAWTPAAVARWQEWLAHYTRRVAFSGQQALYALLPQPETARPVKRGRPLFTYSPEITGKVGEHMNVALALTQQQRWLDAEAEWQRIMALAPEWYLSYAMLGWQYRQLQRWDEAWVMYRRAESLMDLDANTYNDLGAMAWNLGQADEARRCLRLALEQDPNFDVPRRNLDAMEAVMKKTEAAGRRKK
ncbi:MAG: hypothetical protein HGA76_03295 [Candidatus Firestonebacteria bacterium]|nr:hypothetical protein [Candidatus Firestonebacteria bacterium]